MKTNVYPVLDTSIAFEWLWKKRHLKFLDLLKNQYKQTKLPNWEYLVDEINEEIELTERNILPHRFSCPCAEFMLYAEMRR